LLDSIDRESIHAVMSNGVLTITMSKVKEVVPRRIPIRGGE
jgi:HSP20 family molecular chaperone IbpA